MAEEIMNFDLPKNRSSIIKVIGVGGGGSNAVNHMFRQGIKDVDFVVCNTDAQALSNSPVGVKIQLGESLTEGRGAGNKPDIGRQAAIENLDEVIEVLSHNTKMVFITAGMGGGTGTGGAPVIAKATKEKGILTVGIVTIPFRFEGQQRINQAIEGISQLKEHVDSLLVINNEKLREIYGDLKLSAAFSRADDILSVAAKGIAEIITVHGYINVDFADVETVMKESGVAILGNGIASGENRAIKAIEDALTSPLLNNNEVTGADNILLNITSGTREITMDEVGEITDYVNHRAAKNALIIWGTGIDDRMEDELSVTVIATGFETSSIPELYVKKKATEAVPLHDREIAGENQEGFRVKDKQEKEEDMDITQRTIEFDISAESRDDRFIVYDDKERDAMEQKLTERKMAERVRNLKKASEKVRSERRQESEDKGSIEELENIPAYVRKNISIKKEGHSSEQKVSKYKLAEDDEDKIRLRPDNSYLHDNVD